MGTKDTVQLHGPAVEAARLGRFMTISELQRAVGCSSATIYFARHGRRLGIVTARRVARVLKVPLQSILATSFSATANPAEVAAERPSAGPADHAAAVARVAGGA